MNFSSLGEGDREGQVSWVDRFAGSRVTSASHRANLGSVSEIERIKRNLGFVLMAYGLIVLEARHRGKSLGDGDEAREEIRRNGSADAMGK